MNKAFVREPDDTGDRNCPRCGSLGVAVGEVTLDAQLAPELRSTIARTAYFCPYARCEVVYFDVFERTISREAFGKPVWPKDPAAPLCACFGFTDEEIEADLREGGVRRTRELIDRAKSAEARCQQCSPSGQSCVAQVQKFFMQRRGGA